MLAKEFGQEFQVDEPLRMAGGFGTANLGGEEATAKITIIMFKDGTYKAISDITYRAPNAVLFAQANHGAKAETFGTGFELFVTQTFQDDNGKVTHLSPPRISLSK